MNRKSATALRWNCELVTQGGFRALWTFTAWTPQPVPLFCRQWSFVAKRMAAQGFSWVRVFEFHDTHGLHVHCIAGRFYDIEKVRECLAGSIFGRIDVRPVQGTPDLAVRYVSKYVSKARREPALKGRRLWACVGVPNHERVKDVHWQKPWDAWVEKARQMRPQLPPLAKYRLGYALYLDDFLNVPF